MAIFRQKELREWLCGILRCAEVTPIVCDIGSSGEAQEVFAPFAAESIIVGFDADWRGQDLEFARGFKSHHLIPKAVCADDSAESIPFVETAYPSSSSTLEPDLDALRHYSFVDYFVPVARRTVEATTLNKVLDDLGYPAFDWIKVDSQGIDLQLTASLRSEAFSNLLAVDIEPGVVRCYQGEDYFVDTHAYLFDRGFWLADIYFQSYPRASKAGLELLGELIDDLDVPARLGRSPTAAEARYFRGQDFYAASNATHRQIVLALVFALADNKVGFAADILHLYLERFGDDEITKRAKKALREMLRASSDPTRLGTRIKRRIARALRR